MLEQMVAMMDVHGIAIAFKVYDARALQCEQPIRIRYIQIDTRVFTSHALPGFAWSRMWGDTFLRVEYVPTVRCIFHFHW